VAFDADTGDRVWTAQEGALNPVWPAGGSLFAVSDRNQLLRIDAGSGEVIWAENLPGYTSIKPKKRGPIHAHYGPVMAGGRLVVVSSDGMMRSFDPENGALLGTVEIPDGATTAPAVAGGTLYVVSSRGELHAFR
jgi:outer membrane protein assembly factor BamB